MSFHPIKFIAADMDGTLLNEQGELDPEFFEIYQRIIEQNIIFAAASGRQYYSLIETFSAIKEEMIFIAENGTLVMHQGKELYSCTIDKTAIDEIIVEARGINGAHIVLCGKKSAYIETVSEQAIKEIKKYYHHCESVDDLLKAEDEFIKVAICHFSGSESEVYPVINSKFGDSHKVVVSAKIWLDIMNLKASKGAAIEYLQSKMGFSFEETMSFGDYFNDIEMLQASYYSYAMENAHEGVKRYARYQAPSNHNSGVLQVINNYLQKHYE
jgi:Cof subfamily protein (haloacid dehalogenase superfamily)